MSKRLLIIVFACVWCVLLLNSFMPWTFYSDINQHFTGLYSYQNVYGKPAILLLFASAINGILLISSALWTRYVSVGFGSVFLAYGIRSFSLYATCQNGNCPKIEFGLWVMILSVVALFILSLFGKVNKAK